MVNVRTLNHTRSFEKLGAKTVRWVPMIIGKRKSSNLFLKKHFLLEKRLRGISQEIVQGRQPQAVKRSEKTYCFNFKETQIQRGFFAVVVMTAEGREAAERSRGRTRGDNSSRFVMDLFSISKPMQRVVP